MKKGIQILLVLVMVISILGMSIVGCAKKEAPAPVTPAPVTPAPVTPAPAAEVYEWKWKTIWGAAEIVSTDVLPVLINDVEVMSDGRMIIEPFFSGELLPDTETLDACGRGVVEMGGANPVYSSGKYPELITEWAIPRDLRTIEEVYTLYFERGYYDFIRETYAQANTYPIGCFNHGGCTAIISKEFSSADDIAGMKIRTIGAVAKWFEAMGASTTYVTGGEVYTALALGTFDGATWAAERSFLDWKWCEVAKYILHPWVNTRNSMFGPRVNMDKWQALPDDLKKIMSTVFLGKAFFLSHITYYAADKAATKTMIEEYGCKVVTLTGEDERRMTEAAEEVWASIAKESPRAKQAIKIITDYLRELGYTDFDVEFIE